MIEDRDREILAAEYEAAEMPSPAFVVRSARDMIRNHDYAIALRAISRARAQEREAIVAWLRDEAQCILSSPRELSDAIEAGAHLTPSPEGEGES